MVGEKIEDLEAKKLVKKIIIAADGIEAKKGEMAQSKMVKTFEDVEEKLRKRNGEEFKEYENLFTVNDCLMPFLYSRL